MGEKWTQDMHFTALQFFLNSQLLNAPRIFQTEEYNAKDPQAKPNRFAHEASAKVVKNFVKDVHCNLTWIFFFVNLFGVFAPENATETGE